MNKFPSIDDVIYSQSKSSIRQYFVDQSPKNLVKLICHPFSLIKSINFLFFVVTTATSRAVSDDVNDNLPRTTTASSLILLLL